MLFLHPFLDHLVDVNVDLWKLPLPGVVLVNCVRLDLAARARPLDQLGQLGGAEHGKR